MGRAKNYAVAASGQWTDEEEGRRRLPSGEVHAWEPGMNQTVCGLSLSRSQLSRFAGVRWPDILPESGGAPDPRHPVGARASAGGGGRGAPPPARGV